LVGLNKKDVFVAMGGDSTTDYDAAKEATQMGIKTYSFATPTGSKSIEQLQDAGFDLVTDTLGAVDRIFDAFNNAARMANLEIGKAKSRLNPILEGANKNIRERFLTMTEGIYPKEVSDRMNQTGYNPIFVGFEGGLEYGGNPLGWEDISSAFLEIKRANPGQSIKVGIEMIPPINVRAIKNLLKYEKEYAEHGTIQGVEARPGAHQDPQKLLNFRERIQKYPSEVMVLWLLEQGFDVMPVDHEDVEDWIRRDNEQFRYGGNDPFYNDEEYDWTDMRVGPDPKLRAGYTSIRRNIHHLGVIEEERPDIVAMSYMNILKLDLLLNRDGNRSLYYIGDDYDWKDMMQYWDLSHDEYRDGGARLSISSVITSEDPNTSPRKVRSNNGARMAYESLDEWVSTLFYILANDVAGQTDLEQLYETEDYELTSWQRFVKGKITDYLDSGDLSYEEVSHYVDNAEFEMIDYLDSVDLSYEEVSQYVRNADSNELFDEIETHFNTFMGAANLGNSFYEQFFEGSSTDDELIGDGVNIAVRVLETLKATQNQPGNDLGVAIRKFVRKLPTEYRAALLRNAQSAGVIYEEMLNIELAINMRSVEQQIIEDGRKIIEALEQSDNQTIYTSIKIRELFERFTSSLNTTLPTIDDPGLKAMMINQLIQFFDKGLPLYYDDTLDRPAQMRMNDAVMKILNNLSRDDQKRIINAMYRRIDDIDVAYDDNTINLDGERTYQSPTGLLWEDVEDPILQEETYGRKEKIAINFTTLHNLISLLEQTLYEIGQLYDENPDFLHKTILYTVAKRNELLLSPDVSDHERSAYIRAHNKKDLIQFLRAALKTGNPFQDQWTEISALAHKKINELVEFSNHIHNAERLGIEDSRWSDWEPRLIKALSYYSHFLQYALLHRKLKGLPINSKLTRAIDDADLYIIGEEKQSTDSFLDEVETRFLNEMIAQLNHWYGGDRDIFQSNRGISIDHPTTGREIILFPDPHEPADLPVYDNGFLVGITMILERLKTDKTDKDFVWRRRSIKADLERTMRKLLPHIVPLAYFAERDEYYAAAPSAIRFTRMGGNKIQFNIPGLPTGSYKLSFMSDYDLLHGAAIAIQKPKRAERGDRGARMAEESSKRISVSIEEYMNNKDMPFDFFLETDKAFYHTLGINPDRVRLALDETVFTFSRGTDNELLITRIGGGKLVRPVSVKAEYEASDIEKEVKEASFSMSDARLMMIMAKNKGIELLRTKDQASNRRVIVVHTSAIDDNLIELYSLYLDNLGEHNIIHLVGDNTDEWNNYLGHRSRSELTDEEKALNHSHIVSTGDMHASKDPVFEHTADHRIAAFVPQEGDHLSIHDESFIKYAESLGSDNLEASYRYFRNFGGESAKQVRNSKDFETMVTSFKRAIKNPLYPALKAHLNDALRLIELLTRMVGQAA